MNLFDEIKNRQKELRSEIEFNIKKEDDIAESVITFLLDDLFDTKLDMIKQYLVDNVEPYKSHIYFNKNKLIKGKVNLNNIDKNEILGLQFVKDYLTNDGIMFPFDKLSSKSILNRILGLMKKNYKELGLDKKDKYTTKDFEAIIYKRFESDFDEYGIVRLYEKTSFNELKPQIQLKILNEIDKEKVVYIDKNSCEGEFRLKKEVK